MWWLARIQLLSLSLIYSLGSLEAQVALNEDAEAQAVSIYPEIELQECTSDGISIDLPYETYEMDGIGHFQTLIAGSGEEGYQIQSLQLFKETTTLSLDFSSMSFDGVYWRSMSTFLGGCENCLVLMTVESDGLQSHFCRRITTHSGGVGVYIGSGADGTYIGSNAEKNMPAEPSLSTSQPAPQAAGGCGRMDARESSSDLLGFVLILSSGLILVLRRRLI